MINFEYIWLLLLLPVPIVLWLLLPAYKEEKESVRIPFFDEISSAAGLTPSQGAVVNKLNLIQKVLAPLVWVLLVLAVAKPVWVDDPIIKIKSARDLLLAVDISQSMDARDFRDTSGIRIDRLSAVKYVLDDFITQRKGDRIGLILFGGGAYPQVPFTLDHKTCRLLLEQAETGMAGPQTVIGDAIGLGIKMFEESTVDEKVLILLTDGNDTGSKMPPIKAAEIASNNGIVIHTIGIGDPNAKGEDKVDLSAIVDIAKKTGGLSFRGEDTENLQQIYTELDELNPENFETNSYRPKYQLYFYPIGAIVFLLLTYHIVMWIIVRVKNNNSESRITKVERGES